MEKITKSKQSKRNYKYRQTKIRIRINGRRSDTLNFSNNKVTQVQEEDINGKWGFSTKSKLWKVKVADKNKRE